MQAAEQRFIEALVKKFEGKLTISRWQQQVSLDGQFSRMPLTIRVTGKASKIHALVDSFEQQRPYAQVRHLRFLPRGKKGEANIELKISYSFYSTRVKQKDES